MINGSHPVRSHFVLENRIASTCRLENDYRWTSILSLRAYPQGLPIDGFKFLSA